MKTLQTTLASLSKDRFLRNDEKYQEMVVAGSDNLFSTPTKDNVLLSDVLQEDYSNFTFEDGIVYKGIPTGQSYIDEDGDIVDFQRVTIDNHPGRLKYAVKNDNLLISSLRFAKSPALMFENLNLSEYVFSNGFYVFKVKEGWDRKFVLYMLRSKRIKDLIDNNIYRGIGISAYRADDLLKCEIPRISLEKQRYAISLIQPIEKKIRKLKETLTRPEEIIDSILSSEFEIDVTELQAIDAKKIIHLRLSEFDKNNINGRFSYRWNKAVAIQESLISSVSCCKKLANYIVSTQNGWSPDCDETQSTFRVLGIDAIKPNGVVSFDNVKYSDAQKNNIESYFVNNGDFFVSRGNTTELVALASIAYLAEGDPTTIFPDLMIRVVFSNEINKVYMAYIFNSFIGRLYFKYVTKGKNQTMVKVSPRELQDFYVPIPDIDKQDLIVSKIEEMIESQTEIKRRIARLRSDIDTIIEKTIAGG